jgi:hypothetical protein
VVCLCAGFATPALGAEPEVHTTSPSASPALAPHPVAVGANGADGEASTPYGYHIESSPRWNLVGVGGGIALIGGILAVGSWTSRSTCSGTPNPEGCNSANQDHLAPTIVGAALATSGLVLAGVGLLRQSETLVPDRQTAWMGTPFRPDAVKVSVHPVGTSGTGLNLALTF